MYKSNFWNFLKQLLTAYWRSLLLLLIGVYFPLQIFEQLAVQVWQHEDGFPWDAPLLLAIHTTAQPQIDAFVVILTKFGSVWTVLPIITAIALVLLFRRRWRSLAYLLITVLGSAALNRIAKVLLHRVRPQLWESPAPEFDYGFPSGHAMTSMTLVIALVILTWDSSWRWLILTVGSLYILAIGWTRMYLGVHFPSDILAGWMVSLSWAIGVSLLIRPHLTKATTGTSDQAINETILLPEEVEFAQKSGGD